ncbi:MAG: class I SAM-dependent methyltransferase [Thiobacillus sp.]
MSFTKTQLIDLYRIRAEWYDFSANLYYLIGFREAWYRKQAVSALGLKPGDAVVEIGCGTGLNFGYLRAALGEAGKVVGLDLTDAMLRKPNNVLHAKDGPTSCWCSAMQPSMNFRPRPVVRLMRTKCLER